MSGPFRRPFRYAQQHPDGHKFFGHIQSDVTTRRRQTLLVFSARVVPGIMEAYARGGGAKAAGGFRGQQE